MNQQVIVEEWRTVDEYVGGASRFFRSRESWRWFERHHRAELVSAGAVSYTPAGKMVRPALCEAVVLQVGMARAQTRAKG